MAVENSKYSWIMLVNDHRIADLTGLASSRKFSITRNDSDEISFTISLDKLAVLADQLQTNVQNIIQSAVSEVRVLRYGSIISAGEVMPWDTKVGSDRMINITAKGWFELLKYRRITHTYTAGQSQAQIIAAAFAEVMARTYGSNGNFSGLQMGVSPSPDTTTVYVAEQPYDDVPLYQIIKDMTDESGGIDMEVTYDKKLNLYTQIGRTRADVSFTYPGNVQDITFSVDPTRQFNSLRARGKGEGTDQLETTAGDIESQQKYGLREDTKDYSNVGSQQQLQSLADADVAIYKVPLIIHQIIYDGSGNVAAPAIGSIGIGDRVPLSVSNFQLYQDVNRYFTIDKIEVEIDDKDKETVTLTVS